ncbi:MAG TPA: NAD(P)/FAD-dependent oxidoreductase [Rhizomicrobium sp.]|jgi:NADH dehydrogenase|nr:NAD(P)/FAD-dependent oxidoreductase [Rhizomicrobium sp.]
MPKADPRTHILIIGAGFAGIEVARGLRSANADVTLIDCQNYHLFQPLLYQVATAALSPADIAEPVRRMLRRCLNVTVLLGEVTGISAHDRRVALAGGVFLSYDILVLATGATHAYFGHDGWEEFAPGLKSIADARSIRSQLLRSFEQAEMSRDPAEKKRLMTFVVVGGGPSGVELAGSIAELARHTLAKDFHHIDPKSATVLLLEAGPRILSAFPDTLARYARTKLTQLGVTVRENCAVKNIACDSVEAGDDTIPNGLTIWAAGVKASPLGRMLGVATDKAGRVKVDRDLSVPGLANVYVLGDLALAGDRNGKPLPGLAQVAKQQGQYLGKALARAIRGEKRGPGFEFRDRGNVAVIGRHAAIADFGWARLKGTPAWILWALVHIYLLAGLQHRMLVAVQWAWRYVTYDRGARLIVEPAPRGDKTC